MNPSTHLPGRIVRPSVAPPGPEAVEGAFARRVAARLSDGCDELSPVVAERLRFARTQAVLRAREVRRTRLQPASSLLASGNGIATLGGHVGRTGWRLLGALLPVLLILAGLWVIDKHQSERRLRAAVDIDAQLLTDVLPPNAYADPGFKAFLARGEPLVPPQQEQPPHDETAPSDQSGGDLQ